MIERRKKNKFVEIHYLFGYYVNLHGFARKWIFQNLIFPLHTIITPLIMDQLTCSLPKNVTIFHGKKDGSIHICLSLHKRGALALWIFIVQKKIIDFFNLIFQLHHIITSSIFDLIPSSLPKNVTIFHRKEDGIIQFCLSP